MSETSAAGRFVTPLTQLAVIFQMIFHTPECVQVGQLSLKQIKFETIPNDGIVP